MVVYEGIKCATVRACARRSQSRRQKAHRTVYRTCPVHHWTVRWPHKSELQRSNPNGWVTWLTHWTVSGGAPDCPVRPSTEAIPNGHFGGWGYKYPQPPHIQGIQVFNLHTSYKSYSIQYKDTNKEIKASPKSVITPNKLVIRERDICVLLSSCAWIAFLLPHSCFHNTCNQNKRHQLCGGPCSGLSVPFD
jgi:hypothetical protein